MTGMTLDIDEVNGGAVFHLGGRVMFEGDSLAFRQKLDQELERDKRWIVLDLSRVIAISSTGLGILIAAHRSIVDRGGSFKLAQLSDKVKSILETTRLNSVFEIFDSVDKAVKKARTD